MLVKSPNDYLKIEKPKKLNFKTVIYWVEKEGVLIGDQQIKAEKFLEFNCIEKTEKGFICKPIPGYNKSTYKLIDGKCSCQFNKKYGKNCSHLLALFLFQYMERWNH